MDTSDRAAKDKVMAMIKDMSIGMLSTRGPDGRFHTRPMAVSDATFDGTLYFLTDIESGKIHDLDRDPETLVSFSDPGRNRYVSLHGHGVITQDHAALKDHWTEAARGWFPKGEGDPNIALISVEIDDAEFWDAPSGKMVVLYAYAKALVTGLNVGEVGDHRRVSMR